MNFPEEIREDIDEFTECGRHGCLLPTGDAIPGPDNEEDDDEQ